ncbi:MAG: heparinase II/III family protein [Pseudomonadota bacterium]
MGRDTASAYGDAHPRLLVTAQEIAALGDTWRSSPSFLATVTEAQQRMDEYFSSPPDVPLPKDAGGGYTHEQHKRNAKAIHDAAMLSLWTGDSGYAEHARDLLLAYADMYPELREHPEKKEQSPGRMFWQSLNEAWWLVYAIQGYDAIYSTLSADHRERIENRLFRTMVSFLGDESPQTFDKIHNHGTWATAAVGMTGYVLGEHDYVEKALLGLKKDGSAGFLKQLDELFSPEGYYTEGPYYQRYAMMPFVVFAKSIERNEPGRQIFEHRDGILNKAIYTTVQLSYAGLFFPINDAIKDKGLDTVELDYALSIAYGQTADASLVSLIDDDSSLVLTADGLRLAMARDRGQAMPFEFATSHFRDGPGGDRGALSVLRSGHDDGHTAVVFKATSQGMGHGHFDRLNWLYFDNGAEVVSDYGAARFLNVVQKYGGHYLPENKTWAKQTVAHNTLVVDQTSHFDGRVAPAEAHPPTGHLFAEGEGIRVAAAREAHAYPGVDFQRAVALIDVADAPAPLLVDVLRAGGDQDHRFDLPLYYQGQMIDSSADFAADTDALAPVGDANGYQHLWRLSFAAVDADEAFAFTWLLGNRFYTYHVLADAPMDVLQTQIGANDPDTNLRNDRALMMRSRDRRAISFVNVMEAHGEYNGAREYTLDSASQVTSVGRQDADDAVVVDIKMSGGEQIRLALSFDPDTSAAHTVTLANGDRVRWTGFYQLWREPSTG